MRGYRQAILRYLITSTLSLSVVVFLWYTWTPTAHADPHATFYTTVGQQQLFFNTLAALDQADYVESPTLRKELLDKRTAAGFEGLPPPPVADTKATIRETQTGLSNVITRPVTLEGYDQFTAELENQFALEAKRRRDFDLVIRKYCTLAFGREDCEEDDNSTIQPELALVTDAGHIAQQVQKNGVEGVVMSGTTADQLERSIITNANDNRPTNAHRAYSSTIAALRAAVAADPDEDSKQFKEGAINKIAQEVQNISLGKVNPDTYSNLAITKEGNASLKEIPENTHPIDAYTSKMFALVAHPLQVHQEARSGAGQVRAFQVAAINNGYVAKTGTSETADDSGQITTLRGQIQVPAQVRADAANQGLNNVAGGTINQLSANANLADKTGARVELVNRPDVAGILDRSNQSSEGQVLGEREPSSPDVDKVPLSQGVPHGNFADEQGPNHFLFASGDSQGGSNGCGCSLHGAMKSSGNTILSAVNNTP